MIRSALWATALAVDPSAIDQGSSGTINLILQFAQYGVIGLLLIDLVGTHKFIIPRWVSDSDATKALELVARTEAQSQAVVALKDQQLVDLRHDLEELKIAQSELQRQMQERYIPALVQVTDIAKDYLEELRHRGQGDGHGPG